MKHDDKLFLDNYFGLYRRLLLETDVKYDLIAFRDICKSVQSRGKKLIFAGNGASASISSHAATDFTQHSRVRSICFNDHNLITAFGNDYGYDQWIVKAMEAYADPGDVIVLISSSGRSPNIVNAAQYAFNNSLKCITFSGFSSNNPLRDIGNLNLWIDCDQYNIVETIHLIWILLVASLIEVDAKNEVFLIEHLAKIYNAISSDEHRTQLIQFRDICNAVIAKSGKLIFAGNGGSSSIASHAATDFTKQSGIRSVAFNDHNLLTAFANDYGQENWIAQCINAYADPKDAVVLISSSGRSKNVINAASIAKTNTLPVVTFTGFDVNNPLRKLGDLNFWIDSHYYSVTEGAHSALVFCVADMLLY